MTAVAPPNDSQAAATAVCLLTCHYPPLSRTYRRYQFARYLADGGCHVTVVAHGNISRAFGTFVDDPSLAVDDPQVPVRRPRALPWHLTGELLHRLGLIPCPHLNWLGPAARAARQAIGSPPSLVLGVYPPLTNQLAAWRVARATGRPLVLDFRDEYLGLHRGRRRPWAAWCEPRLVAAAALISVATQRLADTLASRYGVAPERLHVTSNGWWDDVDGDLALPRRGRVRLVYSGALSVAQGPGVLVEAVRRWSAQHPGRAGELEVVFHGPDNRFLRQQLLPQCVGLVRYGGFLPARAVSAALLGADICFLSLASDDYQYAIPGKLYEYIAHARPLLAALPDGPARQLIESEGFGVVARCGDAADLAAQLGRLLEPACRAACHQRLLARRDAYAARPHFLSLARRLHQVGCGQ
jgi:hypothetical protein